MYVWLFVHWWRADLYTLLVCWCDAFRIPRMDKDIYGEFFMCASLGLLTRQDVLQFDTIKTWIFYSIFLVVCNMNFISRYAVTVRYCWWESNFNFTQLHTGYYRQRSRWGGWCVVYIIHQNLYKYMMSRIQYSSHNHLHLLNYVGWARICLNHKSYY